MKAMLLERLSDLTTQAEPLTWRDMPGPEPGPGQLLVQVSTCGVCHTELDEIEGRTPPPHLPVIPGHQVIGNVVAYGQGAGKIPIGTQVGVAWIYSACGECDYCRNGQENLCHHFQATGRDVHGGYAEYLCVSESFVYPIPVRLNDAQAAPLLCAGAVGFRSLRMAGLQDGQALGLTGFGASAHIVLQLARKLYPRGRVHVFARSPSEQAFALELGADWAGDTLAEPPELLNAVIDTTPVWTPVIAALPRLKPGGKLVINAIRKESIDRDCILGLDYSTHLWMEKTIQSVANVTRADVREFLTIAADIPILPEVQEYPLKHANQALLELKQRKIRGAKVLRIQEV
jgi:alcohol dehydrogenase, propanol-preferring